MSEKTGGKPDKKLDEKPGEEPEESLYDETTRLGARIIAEKTGKTVDEVLKKAREANQEQHDATKVDPLSKENIEESKDNFDKAYRKAQNENKGS